MKVNATDKIKKSKKNLKVSGKNPNLLTTVHYAVQTCDISANLLPGQTVDQKKRYVDAPKTEIIRKCLTSLFASIEYCIEKIPKSQHVVAIFDDHSTQETLDFFERLKKRFSSANIKIEIYNNEETGLMNSTRYCYEWMDREGQGMVYQVQDDMLYMPHAIFEMVDFFNQVRLETVDANEAILLPWNDAWHWRVCYRYKPTLKMVVQGKTQHWLQTWDIPSGFFTGAVEFRKHWDLYEKYLNLPPYHDQLEPDTINKILVEERTIGFRPFDSMAFHLQDEFRDLDPYHDWRITWDAVEKV